jgi:hypothetical protein
MLLVFRKGLEYDGSMNGEPSDKEANIFPLMSLPLDMEGEETDLNDFQWWAYSDKWKEWLEDNPREWQAESKTSDFDKAEAVLENMVTSKGAISEYVSSQAKNIWNNGKVSSFSDYVKLLEAEDESGSSESFKKFVKLGFALEKLAKDGKLKDKLKIEDLEEDKEYSIVIDPMNEAGEPIQEARQAIRIKKLDESAGFILANFDYSIPVGKVKDTENFLDKVSDFAKDVAIAGAGFAGLYAVAYVGGGLLSSWVLMKSARGIYRTFSRGRRIYGAVQAARGSSSAIRGGFATVKNFATRAFGRRAAQGALTNAARITLPSGAFVEGGLAYSTRATGNVLLKGAAEQSVKAAASRAVAQGGARAATAIGARAAAGAGAGALAAEASNPVGWIMLAVQAVGSGINQIWNWYSDKQAPRYSEVEDFAYGTFKPKNIPIGKSITVCWTSDGGAGWGEYILDIITMSKDDTRTTMEIVKIGELEGRSIFMVLQINSEMFQKALQDNDLMLMSFSNSDVFERGYLDNDDLEFQTILIPDITELTIATSFVGYSTWDEMEEAYNKAPDNPVYVPKDAKKTYEFHYVDSEGRDVNVTGTLVSESELEGSVLKELIPGEADVVEESFDGAREFEDLLNESKVVSFSDFSMRTSNLIKEEENEDPAQAEEKPAEQTEETPTEDENKELEGYEAELDDVINSGVGLKKTTYSRIPIVSYAVNTISFVDPNINESPGEFSYFLVGDQSVDPKPNQPILVESASDDLIGEPRFGLKKYVPPTEEDDEGTIVEPDEEVIDIEDVDKKRTKISTDRADVQIKSGSRSLSIKDRDIEGGISILAEFGTDDLKRKLNIEDWEEISSVKVRENSDGEPIKVVLKNRFAKMGDRRRVLRKGEQGFNTALKFANSVEDGISFSG